MHRQQRPEPCLYPATPTQEPDGGITIVFRDLLGAITYGDNDGEARAMAKDVLELSVAERMEQGEDVPAASAPRPGDTLVELGPLLAAKAARTRR